MAGHTLCPVVTYERYVSRLDPRYSVFLQQPKRGHKDYICWYEVMPLGHNVIGYMMPSISKSAELSIRYTNHCLRTTSVTVLDNAQFPDRHIMTVSGHKSETSLKQYSHHTSETTKRSMSTTLNRCLGLDVRSQTSTSNSTVISPTTVATVASADVSENTPIPESGLTLQPLPADNWVMSRK